MRLPTVDPAVIPLPTACPHGCGGEHFKRRQVVVKPLRDTELAAVEARRYGGVRCGCAFRVYPGGVSHAQTSTRRRGLGVLLSRLGLSYGAVALALEALGHPLSKVARWPSTPRARRRARRSPACGAPRSGCRSGSGWLPPEGPT